MAIGDTTDIVARIRSVLPPWFGDEENSPILTAVLTGFATGYAVIYDMIQFVKLQTRVATATGGFLDMIAFDFFGFRVLRKTGQSDVSFRARIITEILRPRGTRPSVIRVLEDLTGRTPTVFEPRRPADTGAWNNGATLGYGMAGAYGSLSLPFQSFVTAYRPSGTGIPYVAGYGNSVGAYNTPSRSEYGTMSAIEGAVLDSDIYAAVNSVRPVGTIIWVRIES